jgi:hypothetical protein
MGESRRSKAPCHCNRQTQPKFQVGTCSHGEAALDGGARSAQLLKT